MKFYRYDISNGGDIGSGEIYSHDKISMEEFNFIIEEAVDSVKACNGTSHAHLYDVMRYILEHDNRFFKCNFGAVGIHDDII